MHVYPDARVIAGEAYPAAYRGSPSVDRLLTLHFGHLVLCFCTMLLIAAALSEELAVAMEMCVAPARVPCRGTRAWTARYKTNEIFFLKTGVGPSRSARALELFLAALRPTEVLVIGYAGALDPTLQPGDLVIVQRAASLRAEDKLPLEKTPPGRYWEMAPGEGLVSLCRHWGIEVIVGDILTSRYVVGLPAQKQWLRERFGAALVDMETAELARVAASKSLPLRCVRSVSDLATDTFLAPLSFDPAVNPATRAIKLAAAGHWIRRFGQWRQNAMRAREGLHRFLTTYLDSLYD
jgi:adenosylhomocysteine nucleosidase